MTSNVQRRAGALAGRYGRACLLAVCAALVPPVHAANFCVKDSPSLLIALVTAAQNGEDDEIRLETGVYPTPPGGFAYQPDFSLPAQDLSISGGWKTGFSIACLFNTQDANDTLITGASQDSLLGITGLNGDSAVDVRLLRFEGGLTQGTGGALSIEAMADFSGTMTVERNVFIDNAAPLGGALYLSLAAPTSMGLAQLLVLGNLFRGNHAVHFGGAAWISLNGQDPVQRVALLGNTVIDNSHGSGESHDAAGVYISGKANLVFVANNLLWNNRGAIHPELQLDLRVTSSGGDFLLFNNNIGFRQGVEPGSSAGNLSLEPQLAPCAGSCADAGVYVPTATSPLVDAGMDPGSVLWQLYGVDLAHDLLGAPRIAGAGPDIGAYENSERLFSDGFES